MEVMHWAKPLWPAASWYVGKERGPWYIECQKGEEMDSASCAMHGDLVFPGIDTTKAERWYTDNASG